MQRRCLLCVFAATCICVAHGVVLQTDVPRLHTSFHNRALRKLDAALSKSALNELSHTYDLGHGRKLEQSSSPVCFWDQNSDECSLATTGREHFLNQADNVVAGFLLRTIQCEDAQYKEGCEEMNCIWVEGSGCFVRHDEVRDFYDVDCMEEVQYLVEALAGNHECLPRETEMECSGFERCYWNDGRCNFDRWRFYHGIPTVDGYPETFQEVLAARNLQLTNDIQDATDNGDVGTYADLPGWDPPAFNCPVIYEEVICNYVDALTPYLVYTLYCGSQYQSATDIIDCNNDPLCAADTNNPGNICGPSQDALLPSLLAAELAFALGIEDPEAQLYECTRTECLYITEESECEENCEWVNDACRLSDKWQEEEVYRIVGDTDNPVCQYYVLPATSGCYDRDGEDECTNDPLCFYVPETGQCEIAFNAQVAFSLELSGLSESYDATTAECEAQDEEETCEAVEAVGPEQRGRGGRGGGRRDREDEEGASDTISTLSANQGGQISEAAAPSSVSADDEELEEIEGSLPELIEPPEASAEPSIEAMSPSASSAVDDEIGRVQGLGGILGFGRR